MTSNGTQNPAALQQSLMLLQKATQAEKAGDKALALKAYQAAINACPANGACYPPYIQFLVSVRAYPAVIALCKALPQSLYGKDLNIRFSHAIALIGNGDLNDGIDVLERLRSEPGVNPGLVERNLGSARQRLQQYEQARAHYRNALASGLDSADVHLDMARTYVKQARFDDAERCFQQALGKAPGHADIVYERALMLLQQGKHAEGFADYAQRWSSALYPHKKFALDVAEWTPGEPCEHLLVLCEQGIGDQILLGRFVGYALGQAGQVTFACDPRLHALFERAYPGLHCIRLDDAKAFANSGKADRIIYLGDLGQCMDDSDAPAQYLNADAARVQALREAYRQRFPDKQLVGLSWRSVREVYGDFKSVPLALLSELIEDERYQCISVQYGDISADLETLSDSARAALWRDEDIDAFEDIEGLACQLCALDVLVTTSNSTAHLAAALGVRTLLLLPQGAGLLWYWGYEGERVAWYPSITALRAEHPGDWTPALTQLKATL